MADAPQRPHLILIRVMFTVATILAVFAVLAVWVNRQALNADNWSNTSASVLADPAVKQQVADYLVDEVYANVDVAGQIRTALPPRLQPLAGPVAGGLRQFATRTTLTLLSRPRVEKAWQEANRSPPHHSTNTHDARTR